MTQEEKQLLLQDLCARLPYGVKCKGVTTAGGVNTIGGYSDAVGKYDFFIEEVDGWFGMSNIVPYLRSMSSMTKEERKSIRTKLGTDGDYNAMIVIDYYNAHQLDYRGLIEKGLALEAPEGMYNTKQ